MTKDRLVEEMSEALKIPGIQNAWTMPIKARVDMLTTGIRTPIGIKVFGKDLKDIAAVAEDLERILKDVPGTQSVYAQRELGGFFLDFVPDRAAIGRYGLKLMDVMQVVETAIGGMNIDTTVEGRERYTINVRYPRELRSSVEKLRGVLVSVSPQGGALAAGAEPMGAPGPSVGNATSRNQERPRLADEFVSVVMGMARHRDRCECRVRTLSLRLLEIVNAHCAAATARFVDNG